MADNTDHPGVEPVHGVRTKHAFSKGHGLKELQGMELSQIQDFDGMLRAYELRLREYDKALREALANRDTMQKDWQNMRAQLEEQRRDKDAQIARINRELTKAIRERDRLRAKLEAEMAKVEKSRKEVWAMLQKEKDAHQKDLADLNTKVEELEATVAELRRKKAPPKYPKQYDGQVVRSELRYKIYLTTLPCIKDY